MFNICIPSLQTPISEKKNFVIGIANILKSQNVPFIVYIFQK